MKLYSEPIRPTTSFWQSMSPFIFSHSDGEDEETSSYVSEYPDVSIIGLTPGISAGSVYSLYRNKVNPAITPFVFVVMFNISCF